MNFLIYIRNNNAVQNVVQILRDSYKESQAKILYISFSRPYKSLSETIFQDENVRTKFITIDTITKRIIPNPGKTANCIYVNSPTSFKDILAAFDYLVKHYKFDNVIFDSLSSLSIYSKDIETIRFVNALLSKISLLGDCESSILCLKSDSDSDLLTKLSTVFDKTIETAN